MVQGRAGSYHPVMAKCGPGDDIYVLDARREY